MTWIYVNDLRGMIPGFLVQFQANKMQKKGFESMTLAMKMYMNKEFDCDNDDPIYKLTEV